MAANGSYGVGLRAAWLAALVAVSVDAGAAEPVVLKEGLKAGETTRVVASLKAQGLYRPAPPPGAGPEAEPPKPRR